MKKLMLFAAFTISALHVPSVMAAMPALSSMPITYYSLDSLDFTDIIGVLYKGQTFEPYVENESISSMPHTKLGSNVNGYQVIGVMHPVITYKNTKGKQRYLVMIEKVKVSATNYKLMDCHSCTGSVDLFIFKRLSNGKYRPVSYVTDNVQFAGSWGRVNLDMEALKSSIQPLGRHLVGGIFETGYLSTGIMQSSWNTLHLNEDDYIKVYRIGDASGDNTGYFGEDAPEAYSYQSTYEVLPDNSKYYPIRITYQGTKPNLDRQDRIEPVNYSEVMRFNSTKDNYE